MPSALLIVDYENEWINKDSEYFVGDISDKIARLNQLIKSFRGKNLPVIFVRHIEEDDVGFKENTKAVEIMDGVEFQKGKDTLITKYAVSPFFNTDLDEILADLEVNELVITGILTNLCVRSAVSDAYDRGFDITIITNTCVAFDEETHEFTLEDLKETRPEIELKSVEEVVKE
ncbi:hypothetical protein COV18_03725 [Candidatus Woesearchaeota archaeon CG10_big_fil_rev_8_21_14_0_10_37_12]|nr:MAG: hypothetical protein COV18_03725 [Candidatus Woesearchaeota archaeon CG10_big_fil_rev_8_21_14_0_10_37_12]